MTTAGRTEIFERLPVKKAVCKQIVPAIASQMIVLVYNLADTYFVGRLNAPHMTAALTVAYPAFMMLTAVSNMFGVGAASVIASALGKGSADKAKQVSSVAFWCAAASAVLFSVLFLLFEGPILSFCGARGATYHAALIYARWVVVIGGPFTVLNTMLANLVRAEGNAAMAAIGVSLGGVFNIMLDSVFILPWGLGLGAEGAGIATAVSNALAALYFLFCILIKRKNTVVSIDPKNLRYIRKHMGSILSVGFPSALQYALTVVAVSAQTRFVSKYTTEAIAGLGIVKKLDQLPLYFSIGVSNGLLPLLAYSHAAGNTERRDKAFRFGCGISVGFSLLCLVCYELFAEFLSGLFIDNVVTIKYSATFLRIMVTAMPFMAVCYPMIIRFQATGKIRAALTVSVLRKGVLDIPLLFLMDSIWPLYGCMPVQPIVDMLSLAVAVFFSLRINRIKEPTKAVSD